MRKTRPTALIGIPPAKSHLGVRNSAYTKGWEANFVFGSGFIWTGTNNSLSGWNSGLADSSTADPGGANQSKMHKDPAISSQL